MQKMNFLLSENIGVGLYDLSELELYFPQVRNSKSLGKILH